MPTTQEVENRLEDMIKNAVHFGHRSFKWNPKMKPYLFDKRNGIHIIDLKKSLIALDKAKNIIQKTTAEGKTILLVSTKAQATDIIRKAAQNCGMPYVVEKWIGGLLTNFSTIKKRIKYLKDLKDEQRSGGFEKYTKKEALNLGKTIIKLENALGGVADMVKLPDLVFIADVVKDKIVVTEARKLKIPVIGIVDSNADPSTVDYPIPGNDDAVKSLGYLINEIESAINHGKSSKVTQENKVAIAA